MAKTPMIFAAVQSGSPGAVKSAYTVPAGKYAIVNVHLSYDGKISITDGSLQVILSCPPAGSGQVPVPSYQGLVCPAGTVIAGQSGGYALASGFLFDL